MLCTPALIHLLKKKATFTASLLCMFCQLNTSQHTQFLLLKFYPVDKHPSLQPTEKKFFQSHQQTLYDHEIL